MKKFQKLDDKMFNTLEAKQLVKVIGGLNQPTQTLPTITVTPTGNKTDDSGSPNDGNDGSVA
jgi:hypothetical protein